MDILLIYNSIDKVSERIILLEFSSLKVSSRRVWKLPWKEMAKAYWNCIDNYEREELEKQIVSDSMYKHNDHYLKLCILCSIVLTI